MYTIFFKDKNPHPLFAPAKWKEVDLYPLESKISLENFKTWIESNTYLLNWYNYRLVDF